MKLNHVDLQVSDVAEARDFFQTHFGFRCVYERKNLALLEDEAGFQLGVSNLFGSPPPTYPPDFHAGFVIENESEVNELFDRLKKAGVPMKTELSRGGPNVYFMCVGPDSIPVEVRAPASSGPPPK